MSDVSHEDKEKIKKDLRLRLRKIEGQVRGIYKMIEEDRECKEILTQLCAIKAAINSVGFTILSCHLMESIKKSIYKNEDPSKYLKDFISLLKKFS